MEHASKTTPEVHDFIAKQLNLPLEQITSASLIDELATDSIQLFELLIAFEKHYQLKTSYEDVIALDTVGDIVEYIDSKIN